jgi:hypothetical protein
MAVGRCLGLGVMHLPKCFIPAQLAAMSVLFFIYFRSKQEQIICNCHLGHRGTE